MPQQLTFDELDARTDTDAEPVDLDDLPKNERVMLIQGITRIIHTPEVVEGTTSSTGKTIEVEDKHGRKTSRLDAEKIFSGGLEVRDATTYELYTPEAFQRKQRANCQPGPRAGCNNVSDVDDLPEPSHRPAE